MKMKRIFAAVLSLCMALTLLAGCQSGGNSTGGSTSGGNTGSGGSGASSSGGSETVDWPKDNINLIVPFAAGGGMEIALSCDMVVASDRAKFGCTEVGLGIIASTGGIVRLARDINRKDCMELLLTGKKIKAEEAQKLGLINYVVPAEEVMDKAIELAEQCLKNAPLALKWTKYLVHAADQMSEEDAMKYCDAAYRFLEKTEDGIEGPAAFVEKREPVWKGH